MPPDRAAEPQARATRRASSGIFWRWFWLAAAAAVLGAASIFAGQNEGDFGHWVSVIIAAGVVGGALVILAAWSWRRQPVGRIWLLAIILAALVFRLAVMPASRELSDDAARYHWDGKCLTHGINPFLHAPDAPEVAHLFTDAIDQRINHPWYRTCYPPLAQVLFAAGYRLSPGRLSGFQALCLLAEIATWLLLLAELRRRALPQTNLLLAAWSPLIIFQGYLPGHLDTLSLPLVTALIITATRRRALLCGLSLALASLIKPLPLLYLPALWRGLGRRGGLVLSAVVAAVIVAFYLPFAGAGYRLIESTWLMATDWSFNGSLAYLLEQLLPLRSAHQICGLLLIALILAATWRGTDLLARMLLIQTAFVICTPTLYPWYLIGLVPLLVLRPEPALLALITLVPLTDEVVIDYHRSGLWAPALWPRLVLYTVFYGLLVMGLRRRWGMFGKG